MKKGQSYIIGFILNILIVFILVVYSYFWALEIYKSTIDIGSKNYIEKMVFDFDEQIENLIKNGGETYTKLETGTIVIRDKEILFYLPAESVEKTEWAYIKLFDYDYTKLSPLRDYSVIKRRIEKNHIIYSLSFPPICSKNKCIFFRFNPTRLHTCSNLCEIYMKKGKTKVFLRDGKYNIINYIDVDIQ